MASMGNFMLSEIQSPLILAVVFLLGLGVGSFLNVLVLRLGTGVGVVARRSRCFSCGKTLAWYELIPVVSFLVQGGRCRGCGSRISWQYPAAELITGLVFLLVFYVVLGTDDIRFKMYDVGFYAEVLYYLLLYSLLIAISVYDFRHKIIPNQFVYPFIVLAGLGVLFGEFSEVGLPKIAAGAGAFAFFAFLWLVSRGRWMGFGDAKLALGIGFLLGPANTTLAVILSFWIGTLVAVPLLLFKKKDRTSHIPFAPFLVMGAFTSWLIGERMITWYFGLF